MHCSYVNLEPRPHDGFPHAATLATGDDAFTGRIVHLPRKRNSIFIIYVFSCFGFAIETTVTASQRLLIGEDL